MTTNPLHLGIALDGAGWHPAAWRDGVGDLFALPYWLGLVATAERGGIDLVTIEDAVGLQSSGFGGLDPRRDEVRGRLDALVLANAIAPHTSTIGIVPTVTVTHTEPFHVSTGIATLDYVSGGRAGWRVQVSGRAHEAAHFGRREVGPFGEQTIRELFDEARDVVEVVRRLWDSWQDDAVIREASTGRYLDADRVHNVEFSGRGFSVHGASITPRPPQGQPLVFALAHQTVPFELAVSSADVVGITPHTDEQLEEIVAEIASIAETAGRDTPLEVWTEIVVLIEDSPDAAAAALSRLDGLHGDPLVSDALVLAGTPAAVAQQLLHWHRRGVQGVRVRPARLPRDLDAFVGGVVPLLRSAGVLERPAATTLRGRLGLGRPANRFEGAIS